MLDGLLTQAELLRDVLVGGACWDERYHFRFTERSTQRRAGSAQVERSVSHHQIEKKLERVAGNSRTGLDDGADASENIIRGCRLQQDTRGAKPQCAQRLANGMEVLEELGPYPRSAEFVHAD